MTFLSEHKDEIEAMYFGEGRSYQEIGDKFGGKSREAVRQYLNKTWPDRVKGRAFRHDQREKEKQRLEAEALEHRRLVAPPCAVCYAPVMRTTGGRGDNRTCSTEHSRLWSKARYLLDSDLRERLRLSMARSILKYPDSYPESAIIRAKNKLDGKETETRTYVSKNSGARSAYEEVMRIRQKGK